VFDVIIFGYIVFETVKAAFPVINKLMGGKRNFRVLEIKEFGIKVGMFPGTIIVAPIVKREKIQRQIPRRAEVFYAFV
jgi:hypothetical protein